MSRSLSSVRSRPAEKCSPSPASKTASMPAGSDMKNCSMPMMVSSSSALRFCGRLSLSTATLPCRSAASEAGSCAGKSLDDIFWLTLYSWPDNHVAMSGLLQRSVLDQRAAAVVERPESFFGRNSPHDFKDVPFAFRLRRHLDLK